MIVAIDCGTTNSRVYVVDATGKVHGKGSRKVGVRDTSITGSKRALEDGLREAFHEALADASIGVDEVEFIISNGMITSEIGLRELPHLEAPVSVDALAEALVEVGDLGVFPLGIPVYFVRGIKNHLALDSPGFQDVGYLDFMRGEEAQVAGLIRTGLAKPPFTFTVLSSHTKYISVSADGSIMGSVTTLSGQIFEAMLSSSSIGKSMQPDNDQTAPDALDQRIIDSAYDWTNKTGLMRSLLMTRFMDVLMHTQWYERKLFVEACIATEDIRALRQFEVLGLAMDTPYVLLGKHQRCMIYKDVMERKTSLDQSITIVSESEAVDSLSIQGLLLLAAKRRLIQ